MDYKKIAEDALAERRSIFEKRKSVNDDANLSDAEKREQFEKMDADMDRLATVAGDAVREGERAVAVRDLATRAGNLAAPVAPGAKSDEPTLHDQFRALARGEVREISLDPTTAVETRLNDAEALTTDLGYAGHLVADTFVRELLESLRDTSAILSLVKVITTASGENMSWPRRLLRTSAVGTPVAEGAAYTKATKGQFDRFVLGANKVGALAFVSQEMIDDGALPIASLIATEMGEDVSESLAAAVLNPTDVTGKPKSLLAAIPAGKTVASTATTTAEFLPDELLDVQYKVNSKYRQNGVYVVSDSAALFARKFKNAEGNYVWQPSVIAGQPDTLHGKGVHVDSGMPVLASASASVIFGDPSKYILRQVRGVKVVQSTEFKFDEDEVTLKANWRGDGGLADENALAVLKAKV